MCMKKKKKIRRERPWRKTKATMFELPSSFGSRSKSHSKIKKSFKAPRPSTAVLVQLVPSSVPSHGAVHIPKIDKGR